MAALQLASAPPQARSLVPSAAARRARCGDWSSSRSAARHAASAAAAAATRAAGCRVATGAAFQRAPGPAPRPAATAARPRRRACEPGGLGVRRRLRVLESPAALPAMAMSSVVDLVANAIGWVMGAGSALLYAPILMRLLRARSAEGMTVWTWVLQLVAFASGTVYNVSRAHPFSTYAETVMLAGESFIILYVILYFQGRLGVGTVALGALFVALAGAALQLPAGVLAALQAVAIVVSVTALVPQIVLNFRQGGTGEWSVVTAALSTAGNALRCFTTITLTGDPLLLTGYVAGTCVNGLLLGQILWYSRAKGAGDEAAPALKEP